MTWIKIDDGFADHPKVLKVGVNGIALQIRALCYCSRQLTDGVIPMDVLALLCTGIKDCERVVKAMVDAKIWKEIDGGYLVHDFLAYNPSRADTKKRRDMANKRQIKLRLVTQAIHGPSRVTAPVTLDHHGTQKKKRVTRKSQRDICSRTRTPTPTPEVQKQPRARLGESQFNIFWKEYPRKKGKLKSHNEWLRIAPDADLFKKILDAIHEQKQSAQWTKEGGQFIPHPLTWLRGKCWEDETDAPAPKETASLSGKNPGEGKRPMSGKQIMAMERLCKERGEDYNLTLQKYSASYESAEKYLSAACKGHDYVSGECRHCGCIDDIPF